MTILRTTINGISCHIATAANSDRTIILCPGFPEYPRPKILIEDLAKEGFNCIYVEYKGTFSSEGIFMKKDPSDDIIELAEYFLTGNGTFIDFWSNEKRTIRKGRLFIIGCSFGAMIAARAIDLTDTKGLAISPVDRISTLGEFPGEYPIKKLFEFVSKTYTNCYRIDSDYLKRLQDDKQSFYSISPQKRKDIHIIHGAKDSTTNPERSKRLQEAGFPTHFVKGKHFSLHSISSDQLIKWLKQLLEK